MRTLALLLALIVAPFAAHAQDTVVADGTIVESAEVAGLALEQLSPGLRQEIAALAGQPLNRERLNALAARIEGEQPEVVAAVRDVAQPDGRVRVVFLVARISDNQGLAENINARYTVEHVDVTGIPDRRVSQELLDELQALVGKPHDPTEADRLVRKLEAELPDYDVRRRMRRGDESGRIRLVFEITRSERTRWLRFTPSRSKIVYHEDHGWSGVVDVPIGGRADHQVNFGFVLGNDDDLIEEYSGYRLRFESRRAGTDRLGIGFELSRFSQDWREVTLAALETSPDLARPYRTRITVEPKVTFAITPRVRVSAGVSTSELKPLDIGPESEHANAFVAGIGYEQVWRRRAARDADSSSRRGRVDRLADGDQSLRASYELRSGTEELDSDLSYRRHFGQARFEADRGDTSFIAHFRAGRITGGAPLFERFTLGDSTTLRGWNKFDLAPAGADRMWHQSVEFSHDWFTYFFDAGSLWNAGGQRKTRLATGVGFGVLSVGFPLNADNGDATFILNVRFGVGF
jgi:hypothetical protein